MKVERNREVIEALRLQYAEAIMAPTESNLTEEDQRHVIAAIDQFLLDMLDYCEQTDIAEKAILAARDALRGELKA